LEDLDLPIFQATLSWRPTTRVLYLETFSVSAVEHRIPMQEWEQRLFRRIGKRSLCALLPVVVRRFGISPNDRLYLVASSGRSIPVNGSREDVVDALYNEYREYLEMEDILVDEESTEYLRNLLSRLEANRLLVRYYQREFNLQPLSEIGLEVPMQASIRNFARGCHPIAR